MNASTTPAPSAVVLDLFGTLVAAPTEAERTTAATQFAEALGVAPSLAESALTGSWLVRHDGHLSSSTEVASHLVARCHASPLRQNALEAILARLADARLRVDATLLRALEELRQGGIRLAVLSDASPDIAEAWARSELARHVDAVVFSCRAGAVKPATQLYHTVLEQLGVTPQRSLYCGDGGGNELAGAERVGIRAVRVERRGGSTSLVFGSTAWSGAAIPDVEALPSLLGGWGER